MRKLTAALACRNQGNRLYGKPFQNLDSEKGICILDQIIACLSKIKCIDEIVLGISEGSHNLGFIDYANENKLKYIIGNEKDVLMRLIQCGQESKATDIFRMTTESPYPYFNLIEEGWNAHLSIEADATFLDNIIDGCSFEIFKLEALQISHKKGDDKHRSELCTLYIRENKRQFKIHYLTAPDSLIRKDIRLTVDYPEDLVVCREVYQHFKNSAPLIPLLEVVEWLDENKKLKALTAPFCKEGYSLMYK